jgi:hypothetical protein
MKFKNCFSTLFNSIFSFMFCKSLSVLLSFFFWLLCCLFFCPFSFDYCVVCSFVLFLLTIMLSVLLSFFFWPLCCLFFCPFSFDYWLYCVVCFLIYRFWLPIWYLPTLLIYTIQYRIIVHVIHFFVNCVFLRYTVHVCNFHTKPKIETVLKNHVHTFCVWSH